MGIINRYRNRLPIDDNTPVISLCEGNTPLIYLKHISEHYGNSIRLYAKFEGLNPTGSFKDRGMTMAVSKAVEQGSQAIICASTGNTSAAAAAYAARAGIKSFVIIPEGNIALGKLAQAMMYGATVLQIKGNFDQGLGLVRELAETIPVTMVNSINPYRLQGQKTAAFEVVDELGRAPDYHALPVGNAGNISAYWMGYQEYAQEGICASTPKMLGYQASGAAPFIHGKIIESPETIATAIRIGSPQSWDKACAAVKFSEGWFADLSDDTILSAQRLLAQQEGIFCEPASAASIAGVLRDIEKNKLAKHSTVVCTLTGHGLKDPEVAIHQCKDKLISVPSELAALEQAILNAGLVK